MRTASEPSAPLAESTFKGDAVISFKSRQAGFKQLASRHHDDVEAGRDFVATKNLSYQSFRAISLDRAAQFLRGRDSQAPDTLGVRQDEDGAVASVELGAVLVHLLKVRMAADPFGRSQPRVLRHLTLLAADGQTLASLCPAPLQHQAAVLRAHSHQEAVRLPAASRIRLKRPLSFTHCNCQW